jgi:DNA-binding transcriptional ArsR family regulator
MSKHLSLLYQAQLVKVRKEGRWVYYSLPGKEAAPPIRAALAWVDSSLAESDQATADAKRLKQVLKINPTELCRKQCRQ